MDAAAQLKKVCKDLNIPFESSDMQDWGIIHSNANRVAEFIAYFYRDDLNGLMQYYVFELIVASYSDAILADLSTPGLENAFIKLIKLSNGNEKLDLIKNYWLKIHDEEQFPVGRFFKSKE